MPRRPLHPCAEPGCPALVAADRCPVHARALEQRRPNRDVRRWYYTVRWQRLRQQVLTAAAQTCAACGQVQLALEVDHVEPHRGDARLFWDLTNLQALCKPCHASKTRGGA